LRRRFELLVRETAELIRKLMAAKDPLSPTAQVAWNAAQ
jgi:hypothetical protein